MTPLAQKLLNDWCQRSNKKLYDDQAGIVRQVSSAKCFEVSAILDFMKIGIDGFNLGNAVDSGQVYLPAPETWVEFQWEGERQGYLLQEITGYIYFSGVFQLRTVALGRLNTASWDIQICDGVKDDMAGITAKLIEKMCFVLYFINTPNILGNVTRLPHAGLQRNIARKMGMTGKFPLHAWTEITLFIDPTGAQAAQENAEVEARLSGDRCLHFVRSFLRFRMGQLERVKAHWRGDASLGIKRSRYIVKPNSQHSSSP